MFSLGQLAKRAERFVATNSPVILTALGVTGALATTYLAGKASFKAAEILREAQEEMEVEENRDLDPREKVELVWTLYIPAAITGSVTVACIILANRIENRRAAALAAAFTISEKAFEEYRAKVAETVGARKEEKVRDELAQDRVNRDPLSNHEVLMIGSGKVLCYDSYTGRYFEGDVESLRKAMNDTNLQVINDSFASLSDFYERIGLPPTSLSEDVGWNLDKTLDLKFSATISDDGRPCIAISFNVSPVRHYNRLY